jgi:phosphatidylserine synthase 2
MGQHVWLLLATIGTELLTIAKWSKGQFPEPMPKAVVYSWTFGAILLVLYPTVRVSHSPSVPCQSVSVNCHLG